MMDINVQIEYSWMNFQELENTDDNIVDVAKPTGLCFFGMVVASSPVYSNVRYASKDYVSSIDAATCCQLAEMIESFKTRTVEALINFE